MYTGLSPQRENPTTKLPRSAHMHLIHARNEQVRYSPLVLGPRLAVRLPALLDIASRAVDDHASEEDGVEPGKRALESGDQAPRDGEEEIASVVNLPSLSVPSVAQNAVSSLGGNRLGVVDLAVLEVRESGTLVDSAALLLAELVLLGVGRVPDVVDTKVGDCEQSGKPDGELVF